MLEERKPNSNRAVRIMNFWLNRLTKILMISCVNGPGTDDTFGNLNDKTKTTPLKRPDRPSKGLEHIGLEPEPDTHKAT